MPSRLYLFENSMVLWFPPSCFKGSGEGTVTTGYLDPESNENLWENVELHSQVKSPSNYQIYQLRATSYFPRFSVYLLFQWSGKYNSQFPRLGFTWFQFYRCILEQYMIYHLTPMSGWEENSSFLSLDVWELVGTEADKSQILIVWGNPSDVYPYSNIFSELCQLGHVFNVVNKLVYSTACEFNAQAKVSLLNRNTVLSIGSFDFLGGQCAC